MTLTEYNDTVRERDAARDRLDLAKAALLLTGYFTEGQVSHDIAPRITELWSAWESERDAARAALGAMTIDRNGHRALSAEMEDACDALAKALRRALSELGGRHTGHWDSTMQGGRGCPVCIHEGDTTKELAVVLAAHEAQKEGA